MTIRVSTGLRVSLLSDYGLAALMNYGTIRVFSGPQPVSASLIPTGLLLANVTLNGTPFLVSTTQGALTVAIAPTGGLGKVGEWRMKGVANGTAGWWRWTWNSPDDDGDSDYYPRVDGLVGESLLLTTTAITPATNVVISGFNVNITE